MVEFVKSQQFQTLTPSKKLIVCAHSMSAKVACELLASFSSSAHVEITGLLLLAPAPPTPLILPVHMKEQQLIAYSTLESAKWTMQNVLTAGNLNDNVIDQLAKDAAGRSTGAKRGWIEVGMGYDCSASLEMLSGTLAKVLVRVLVGSKDVVETVDRVKRETTEVYADHGCDINMRVVEGVGHLLPVEAVDDVVLEIVRLMQAVS